MSNQWNVYFKLIIKLKKNLSFLISSKKIYKQLTNTKNKMNFCFLHVNALSVTRHPISTALCTWQGRARCELIDTKLNLHNCATDLWFRIFYTTYFRNPSWRSDNCVINCFIAEYLLICFKNLMFHRTQCGKCS